MFWEIGKLGKSYIDWIFTPEDKDLRFFASDFLENLTVCQWYIIPLFWFPIISLVLYRSHSNFVVSGGYEVWMPGLAGGEFYFFQMHFIAMYIYIYIYLVIMFINNHDTIK